MEKLYWLDQINLQDRAFVGDKAFYLSKIKQRGYPVGPGFVVSGEVLREFLETLNSSESLTADLPYSSLHLDVDNWRQLQSVAGCLRAEIIAGSLSSEWISRIFDAARQWQGNNLILRPSVMLPNSAQVVNNLSGLLDAVFCACNEDAIVEGLKLIWCQLFRAKSLLYWQNEGINLQNINLGVLIQPVHNAIASGVFYGYPLKWEITATHGLGIAIKNGDVLPDIYYIDAENSTVIEQQLGNKMLAYDFDNYSNISEQMFPKKLLDVEHNLRLNILDESQQKQYALSPQYLQDLINLGKQLVNEFGDHICFNWTIKEDKNAGIDITNVIFPKPSLVNLNCVQGMGAARGKITANAYIINSLDKPEKIPPGVIIVASIITPDWFSLLTGAMGIITEQGGLTSHGAILARELGIPAVVSAGDATSIFKSGEKLFLDGDRGEVYRLNDDEQKFSDQVLEAKINPEKSPVSVVKMQNILPSIGTKLLVNLSQSKLIEEVQNLPVDGVGLLRSELMILNILQGNLKGKSLEKCLLEGKKDELLNAWYKQILLFARGFAPRPIFYRSLDAQSSDLSSAIFGERGVFNYFQNPAIFELELQALAMVQNAGYKNIRLILPFVRSVEEFIFCRDQVIAAGLKKVRGFELWIMAEVPSVLFLLPEYIKAGVQGISIGTNDLSQLLLGVDRENGKLNNILDQGYDVLMQAIFQLITMSQDGGIPCNICGQAPVLYPEMIDKLIAWGITSISVEPEAVERVYQAIARAEQRLILAAAREQLLLRSRTS
ncbi:phosphoenolpyruvate synthase [Anabaena sp. FACHB-1237]|uniref:putative PEP-binding protein n=1 Tax=Anabaena sp. FACHB-1237 TaxID=2692769 RepID=UPI0016805271|nr:putative PEP-binding protein [Anabaena sp. FACHB-1237]MBD2139398.1 phosphoenolpyruvate synthase [Anabaena sp. FACHB-1237]